MKRALSVLLAAVMLLTMIPFGVLAAEEDSTDRYIVIARACEAFPEYATTIRGESASTYGLARSSGEKELVVEETRAYSDNITISYLGYSDGTAYILQNTYTCDRTTTATEVVESAKINYTCTLGMYSSYNDEQVIVKGVKYQIYTNGYDSILSQGTITKDTSYRSAYVSVKYNEDSSGYAYISYDIDFTNPGNPPDEIIFRFYVGGNACSFRT